MMMKYGAGDSNSIKNTGREGSFEKRMMCFDRDTLRLRCQLDRRPVEDSQLAEEEGRANQHEASRDPCQNSL